MDKHHARWGGELSENLTGLINRWRICEAAKGRSPAMGIFWPLFRFIALNALSDEVFNCSISHKMKEWEVG